MSVDAVHALAMLLGAGAGPDRPVISGGQQTLRMAASVGHADTADYLLDRGAQIDAIEPTAWMPMRVSALRDRQYRATPDGWAEYNGYPELADLIRAHASAKGDST